MTNVEFYLLTRKRVLLSTFFDVRPILMKNACRARSSNPKPPHSRVEVVLLGLLKGAYQRINRGKKPVPTEQAKRQKRDVREVPYSLHN